MEKRNKRISVPIPSDLLPAKDVEVDPESVRRFNEVVNFVAYHKTMQWARKLDMKQTLRHRCRLYCSFMVLRMCEAMSGYAIAWRRPR